MHADSVPGQGKMTEKPLLETEPWELPSPSGLCATWCQGPLVPPLWHTLYLDSAAQLHQQPRRQEDVEKARGPYWMDEHIHIQWGSVAERNLP